VAGFIFISSAFANSMLFFCASTPALKRVPAGKLNMVSGFTASAQINALSGVATCGVCFKISV